MDYGSSERVQSESEGAELENFQKSGLFNRGCYRSKDSLWDGNEYALYFFAYEVLRENPVEVIAKACK